MASFKNQHYVPKCYLRQFGEGLEDSAINIYNIDRHRAIASASLRHQCSGSYFYGEDLELEKILQEVEGRYAQTVRAIIGAPGKVTESQKVILRFFAYLQHMRTDAAARRSIEFISAMTSAGGSLEPPSSMRVSMKEAVQSVIRVFAQSAKLVRDLKVCLFLNETKRPFITSDDPAVLTNRWYAQSSLTRNLGFGAFNAGVIFLMPLSPQILCVVYDGDVYSVPNQGGWVTLDRDADVDAFNEHQFLNCAANIYFRSWNDAAIVAEKFASAEPRRPPQKHRVNIAVEDGRDGDHVRYKVIPQSEIEHHERLLVHVSTIHPYPKWWPPQIKLRADRKIYSNGSGTGYVRKVAIDLGFAGGVGYRRI